MRKVHTHVHTYKAYFRTCYVIRDIIIIIIMNLVIVSVDIVSEICRAEKYKSQEINLN